MNVTPTFLYPIFGLETTTTCPGCGLGTNLRLHNLVVVPRFTTCDISLSVTSHINSQASRCQQAFSKPCLVNLISKDTLLIFSIWIRSHDGSLSFHTNFLIYIIWDDPMIVMTSTVLNNTVTLYQKTDVSCKKKKLWQQHEYMYYDKVEQHFWVRIDRSINDRQTINITPVVGVAHICWRRHVGFIDLK